MGNLPAEPASSGQSPHRGGIAATPSPQFDAHPTTFRRLHQPAPGPRAGPGLREKFRRPVRIVSVPASAEAARSLLRVRLAKTEIKAPFDGVVSSRTISPGDYITAATVITTLDDLSRMKIEFQVPERFLSKVGAGAKFTV